MADLLEAIQKSISLQRILGDENYINTMIKNPTVLAEKVLKTPSVNGTITLPIGQLWSGDKTELNVTNITIPFYMSNDFGFSLENDWRELVGFDGIVDTLRTFFSTTSAFSSSTQVTPQCQAMSSLVWNGSKFSGFNIECLFICTNRNIDPTKIIQMLATSCLPIKLNDYTGNAPLGKWAQQSISEAGNNIKNFAADNLPQFKNQINNLVEFGKKQLGDLGMVAPYGYGVKFGEPETNDKPVEPLPGTTCTLCIGDWFCANELVVKSVGNVSFSKELIAPRPDDLSFGGHDLYKPDLNSILDGSGFPLYAKCTLNLVPYTMVDAKTFMNYFPKNKGNATLSQYYGNLPS